jgi:RecA-family ATPase
LRPKLEAAGIDYATFKTLPLHERMQVHHGEYRKAAPSPTSNVTPIRPDVEPPKSLAEELEGRGFVPVSRLGELVERHAGDEIEWLLPGLIPMREGATLLTGEGGIGKSTLALQLACCVASGRDFLGMPVAQGNVVYFSAEDGGRMISIRASKLASRLGLSREDQDRLWVMDASRVDDPFLTTKRLLAGGSSTHQPSQRYQEIESVMETIKARLLIIDTLAMVFSGDEYGREEPTRFMGQLNRIAQKFDCAALLLAHPSKQAMSTGDGYSGSTAFRDKARSLIYFHRPANEAPLDLALEQKNLGPLVAPLHLRLRDGLFERIEPGETATLPQAEVRQSVANAFKQIVLNIIVEGEVTGRLYSRTRAHVEIAAHEKARPLQPKAVRDLLDQLEAEGRIWVEEATLRGKPFQRYRIAGEKGGEKPAKEGETPCEKGGETPCETPCENPAISP